MYHIKRSIFFRESSSKMYSPTTFAASMLIAELPYAIICAVCFFLPIYYMPGLQTEAPRAGYQFLMILITELFSVTLGQGLAAITPSTFISSQFDPFIMITFALFCGVTIPSVQMPHFWRSWLFQLDPFTRLIGGMVVTALHELPVRCKEWELNVFQAPANATCGEYMRPFFDRGGSGYVVDPAANECQYCAFGVGDEFYTPLGFSFDNRWRDLGIFLCFLGSNLIIIFMAVSALASLEGSSVLRTVFADGIGRAVSSTSTSGRPPKAAMETPCFRLCVLENLSRHSLDSDNHGDILISAKKDHCNLRRGSSWIHEEQRGRAPSAPSAFIAYLIALLSLIRGVSKNGASTLPSVASWCTKTEDGWFLFPSIIPILV